MDKLRIPNDLLKNFKRVLTNESSEDTYKIYRDLVSTGRIGYTGN